MTSQMFRRHNVSLGKRTVRTTGCARLLGLPLVVALITTTLAPEQVAAQTCGQLSDPFAGLVPTNVIHVDPSGVDQIGGGTLGAPYATIGFAASQAVPGTAVVVHAGTYAGGDFAADVRGTAAAPIWIGGAAGEPRPVIDAVGQSNGLTISGLSYLALHDLEVRNAGTNGIAIDDQADYANPLAAHQLVIRNVEIRDIGSGGNQNCLTLAGVNDFSVVDSVFVNCSGQAIDMLGCHRGTIAESDLIGPFTSGIQAKGGSEDIEILRNRISGPSTEALIRMGGTTAAEFFRPPLSTTEPNFEARNIRALANVLEDGNAAITFVSSDRNVFSQNTIVNPDLRVMRILAGSTAPGFSFIVTSDSDIESNLFHFTTAEVIRADRIINVSPGVDAASFRFSNNLWFASDDPPSSTPPLPSPETNGIYGVDPLLINVVAGDYHLDPLSAAIGAGLDPARTDGDFDRTCYATPPSIGAFEGRPTAVPTLAPFARLALIAVAILLSGITLIGRRKTEVESPAR